MKKRTVLNLLLFAFIASFFVTNLGYESKILLQRLFASSVEILPKDKQYSIDPDWTLKDRDDKQFSFTHSNGKVKFVYFFSSWRAMSIADLIGVQKLYNKYHQKVEKIPSGYIIDQNNKVVAQGFGNTRWNSDKVHECIDHLLN